MPQDKTPTCEVFAPGTAVTHYVIESVIGFGATGVVYLSHDRDLNRKASLKFLSKNLSRDPEWRVRFQHEARVVAQLNHPNIVTVFEVGEHADQPFIAMEYIDGASLDDYLNVRRLSVEEALDLAIQVSDGLTEAHGHGVIHRDIKPSNILVSPRGRAKIVDFGLAALLKKEEAASEGLIVGTAAYMSPEQVQGLAIDSRSDLFSFGVCLYKILTNKLPFAGKDLRELFQAILEKEPLPLAELSANVPLEVERIVLRLLNKSRELRYQHADDLRADLRYTLEAVVSGRVRYQGRPKDYTRSIAVLPFANLSADREQEYFCDGMAEEIINALAKVKGLRVAARTSTLAFKETKEDVWEIGRKLHVETLLEGSVRRSDGRLRVTVQLIDVASGFHLWSERYDKDVRDIFAIQDEIALNVVRALQLLLSEHERQALVATSTTNSQAYDYYLRGRKFFHQSRRQSLQFARQMFQKAAEIDPGYALAYAGIADCCSMLVHYYGESSDVHLAAADQASLRALELDPGLAQAHAARGFALWQMGRFDEAGVEFERAMQLDPHQPQIPYLYGRGYFQRGDMVQAGKYLEMACHGGEHHEAQLFLAQTYTALGKPEAANTAYRLALRSVEKHVELNPDDARAFTMGAVALCRLGEPEAGLAWAERAVSIDPQDAGIQYNVACLFALEGDKDRAIRSLEAAAMAGFAHKDWVDHDPDLDSLRQDPRFKALKWRE